MQKEGMVLKLSVLPYQERWHCCMGVEHLQCGAKRLSNGGYKFTKVIQDSGKGFAVHLRKKVIKIVSRPFTQNGWNERPTGNSTLPTALIVGLSQVD